MSSEHTLQQHRSGWPSCAIWDPCVAGDRKPNSQIPGIRKGARFGGDLYIKVDLLSAARMVLPHIHTRCALLSRKLTHKINQIPVLKIRIYF